MELKQKLELEKSGETLIRLYREGIFYIAYNHSALRFHHFINNKVKILRHELKDGSWYLRIGVVQTSTMLQSLPIKDEQGNYKNYLEVECDKLDTLLENVDAVTIKRSANKTDKHDSVSITTKEKEIISRIANLNLGSITPVEAITMIHEWQNILRQ